MRFGMSVATNTSKTVGQFKNAMAKALSSNNYRMKNIVRVFWQIERLFFNQFIVTMTSDFIISFLIYYQVQFKLQRLEATRPIDFERQYEFISKYEYLIL